MMPGSGTHNGANKNGQHGEHVKYTCRFERLLHAALLAKSLHKGWSDEIKTFLQEAQLDHMEAFEDWLSLSIHEKQADIEQCAANQGRSANSLLLHWTKPEHHKDLIPPNAESQSELFAIELGALFMII